MKVFEVKENRYEELIDVMNKAFEMENERLFENLLPKYYYKENKDMVHFAIEENGQIVSSIGLYETVMIKKGQRLKVGCVGAVSTLQNYRLKGCFKEIMKHLLTYAEGNGFDLLFLGGNRYRYNHFGFENAGRKLVYNVSKRSLGKYYRNNIEVRELNKDDIYEIEECLRLYNRQKIRMLRSASKFVDILKSWNSTPYVCKINDEVIGYFSKDKDNNVNEFIYKKKYLKEMLSACLLDSNEVKVTTSVDELNEKLLRMIDGFNITHSKMFKVLNWNKVAKFLEFQEDKLPDFEKLNERYKIIYGLGSAVGESKFSKDSMYTFKCDEG